MKCRIADFNFQIDNIYPGTEKACAQYLIPENEKCDISFKITEKDIDAEINDGNFSRHYLEYIAVCRKISETIPLHNAFLLHSALFEVDGVGVAFAAHSGTGKTTHMRLWQQLLGEKMTVVNGDKPIIRFFEDEPETPYSYGTPWNGKERLGCNMRAPLKNICFIERANENSCTPMEKSDAVNLIFNQVYMPASPAAVVNTVGLIDRLLSSCKLWKIRCNMDISAAETAYEAIFEREPALSASV